MPHPTSRNAGQLSDPPSLRKFFANVYVSINFLRQHWLPYQDDRELWFKRSKKLAEYREYIREYA